MCSSSNSTPHWRSASRIRNASASLSSTSTIWSTSPVAIFEGGSGRGLSGNGTILESRDVGTGSLPRRSAVADGLENDVGEGPVPVQVLRDLQRSRHGEAEDAPLAGLRSEERRVGKGSACR